MSAAAETVWILEKMWFDGRDLVRTACYAFSRQHPARLAMVDDFHEEHVSRGGWTAPDENVSPFETDDEAVLTDGAGRIEWRIHEAEIEGKEE